MIQVTGIEAAFIQRLLPSISNKETKCIDGADICLLSACIRQHIQQSQHVDGNVDVRPEIVSPTAYNRYSPQMGELSPAYAYNAMRPNTPKGSTSQKGLFYLLRQMFSNVIIKISECNRPKEFQNDQSNLCLLAAEIRFGYRSKDFSACHSIYDSCVSLSVYGPEDRIDALLTVFQKGKDIYARTVKLWYEKWSQCFLFRYMICRLCLHNFLSHNLY